MGEKVKRIKRELKYRGTILDMYCDHVEVTDILQNGTICSIKVQLR